MDTFRRNLAPVLLLVLLVTACAQVAPSPEEPVTQPTTLAESPVVQPTAPAAAVTLRALIRPDEGENVAKFTAAFEQETGVKVEVDFVSWAEIHDKTITALASGGGGYDIVFVPGGTAVEYASGGWFEPIDDLIPAGDRDQWLESVVDLFTFDGHLFAMPWYTGGAHMIYNVEMLQKAGVDPQSIVTWDDFLSACRTIVAAKAAPFCSVPPAKYPGNFLFNFGTTALSMGGDFFAADGSPIFGDSAGVLAAMKLLKATMDEGLFDPAGIAMDDYETIVAFMQGTSAFQITSTWGVTQAERNEEMSTVTGKTGLILIPGSGETRSGGYIYAGGLGVLKTSAHKEEAKRYVAFMTSVEDQKHHAMEGGNLPTRIELFSDADIAAKWKGYETLTAQLPYGRFAPQFTWFTEWDRAAATATQDVMANRRSPEDALTWLVGEANRIRGQ